METRKNLKDCNENDYFEHYLITKRFGFAVFRPFHKNEFDEVLSNLAKFKTRYYFFITKLVPIEKNRLKDIFCDNLERLKNEQTRTEFKTIIQKLIDEIKNSNPDTTEADKPQQPKTNMPDEVKKNEFDKIFKNDIGFTIFTKMFELYKTEKTDLANFSFLFYAMEKDFLVCSQTDFVKFLENDKYNVSIEKIDSRQSGKNKKLLLYDSIKESLQKKHEKSTI